jgi:hypothetical protein
MRVLARLTASAERRGVDATGLDSLRPPGSHGPTGARVAGIATIGGLPPARDRALPSEGCGGFALAPKAPILQRPQAISDFYNRLSYVRWT